MDREQLNLIHAEALDPASDDERDHFAQCPACHQWIDCRRLGDVMHHMDEGHEPLPVN